MNNIHALWDNLFPLNEVDRNYFDGCKQRMGQDASVLWYPSSGDDFRDLIHTNPGLWGDGADRTGMEVFPDVFIHTDYHPHALNQELPRSCFQRRPAPWPREQQGELSLDDDEAPFLDLGPSPHNPVLIHDDGRTRVGVTRLVPLVLSGNIKLHHYSTHGQNSGNNWLAGNAAFMELAVHSNSLGSFTRYVLYLFCDNCSFFNEFVLGRGLKISHLVHFCDGAAYGGGWVRMDFLYRYLGFMGMKYLITEYSFPTGPSRFLAQCRRARRVLNSPGNPHTDLTELCTVPWRNCGTVTVFRVQPRPTGFWGRTRRRMNHTRGVAVARSLAIAGGHARRTRSA